MSRINAVWQLYLFYGVIVGTGMGGSFVPLMSTVARWFIDKRGMVTGIVTAGTYRIAFLLCSVITIIAMALSLCLKPVKPSLT